MNYSINFFINFSLTLASWVFKICNFFCAGFCNQ